jgi:hypothetical protein
MKLRLALLVLVPVASYASAPRSGFVWDDHKAIEHGRLIGSLANVPKLFAHDAMFNSVGGHGGYGARLLLLKTYADGVSDRRSIAVLRVREGTFLEQGLETVRPGSPHRRHGTFTVHREIEEEMNVA